MSTSFVELKSRNESRLAEEKRLIDRKRNAIILVLNHFMDNGYLETAEKLQQEAGITLSKYEVADNIDLLTIVQEYESYYEMKFGKKPKLVRRLEGDEEKAKASSIDSKKEAAERRKKRNSYSSSHMPSEARVEANQAFRNLKETTHRKPIEDGKSTTLGDESNGQTNDDFSMGLVGQKPALKASRHDYRTSKQSENNNQEKMDDDDIESRLIKPLPQFAHDPELKPLAEMITRDIFQRNPNVHWNDVVELEDAKRLLKEAVVMPIRYPELFTGLLSPWCGILLYGPPGTGKTMLAKAVATECRTTFFNISASTIVSKYRGDSEKLVRMLFELARYHAPSTIFLDEIDSIMGQRGMSEGGQEHEASRRMKTELLIQMDGLAKSNELVFLLAASNLPWELDIAMLRRLEKRVLVPLPGKSARSAMLHKLLDPYRKEEYTLNPVIDATEGYSGADIRLLVKEAAMGPVRRLMKKLESNASIDEEQAKHDGWQTILEGVGEKDLLESLNKTKPSTHQFTQKYIDWNKNFGSC